MKQPQKKSRFQTTSGIEVQNLYTSQSWSQSREASDLGRPDEFPYTRGVHSTMYRGRHWTMRQYAGFGSAKESNRRYRMLLEAGQTGLSVAFDLPTQMGYDSDDVMASGEVGKVGVAISSLEDMELLLDQIPLDKVSTSMTINSTASILLAFYIAVAKRRGVSLSQLSGTIQNDLLKEYIARGTYIFPPRPSMRVITDIFDYCRREVPNWNTISISGYHIREAGSTAVQEVAFTLANAIAYVEAAVAAGLEVDSFAKRLSFFFNVHNNFFEEIAKFRAARRMWAKIMKNRFGAKDPASLKLRFHTQTAGCSLTAQQPDNNVVRVTVQALAAVLGGTQSLHTNSMDEALGLPTEKSARLALRTQQVLAYESGVADTVDPMGGSFFVETLTNEIEERVLNYLQRIEDLGGVIRCIETGWIQQEIQNSAYLYQKAVDQGQEAVVGVNTFELDHEDPPEVLKIDPKIEKDQVRRLKAFKKSRKQTQVDKCLQAVEEVAGTQENLMPSLIEAVEAGATLGEISGRLVKVFGRYREQVTI